jgi:hypothetical protein
MDKAGSFHCPPFLFGTCIIGTFPYYRNETFVGFDQLRIP